MTKHLLKLIFILSVSFLSLTTIKAQDEEDFKNSTPEQRAEFLTDWMKTELQLDSVVVPQVYKINLNYARKNQSVINSGAGKIEKYKQVKASSDAKDKELEKIFSREQYQEYQQKKEEMQDKLKQKIKEKRRNG